MCAAVLVCSAATSCSNGSDVAVPASSSTAVAPALTERATETAATEISGSQQQCAADAVAVAVQFAEAVQANDIGAYSVCESASSPPARDRINTLATFGTLELEHATLRGRAVDIPAPPIPNGDLPPHQCGVNLVMTEEPSGWFVTDVAFYCSA